jgi:thymidylate synthase
MGEKEYLNCLKNILENGTLKSDRTNTGTKSMFGVQMKFDLSNNSIPVLTTKKIFWKGVVEELLWFISGDTDSINLSRKEVKIWDMYDRNYLDNHGFKNYEEGELGPIYGHQWRHYGKGWISMHDQANKSFRHLPSFKGIDQLQQCITMIEKDGDSRRIIMNSWNPNQLDQMVLPPCHCFVQFYVANGRLSCQVYQRSGDMALGVPFNIASYGLLIHMICHITGRIPGELILTLGDAHIYLNHLEGVKEQLTNTILEFPKIEFKRKINNIDDFKSEDIILKNYNHAKEIKLKVAV